jgi:rhodanese-related sulfurtransferase
MDRHYRYTQGMSVKRVPPAEAARLMSEGYAYLDVRSVPEFQQGHPAGAYNVPLLHVLPGGRMAPNPDFAAVVGRHFAKDAKLVVGCASGNRSLRAAEVLQAGGWTEVVDNLGGMNGWNSARLPVEAAAPGRTFEELKA